MSTPSTSQTCDELMAAKIVFTAHSSVARILVKYIDDCIAEHKAELENLKNGTKNEQSSVYLSLLLIQKIDIYTNEKKRILKNAFLAMDTINVSV